MPEFVPFKAIRPTRDKAYLVATRSYLSYTDTVLRDKLNNNPYTFLQVIHPDHLGEPPSFGEDRYKKVLRRYLEFIENGILIKDENPSFYIYQQSTIKGTYTGIIGAVAVADFLDGRIKVHEHTLTAREEMFKDYLSATQFNAEPVLLSHIPSEEVDEWILRNSRVRSEYEFTSTDGILHLLWPVSDKNEIEKLEAIYKELSDFYIADGHHRSASSALFHQSFPDIKQGGHFMAMLMSEKNLCLASFSRLIRHSYRSLSAVLKDLQNDFDVKESTINHVLNKDEFLLYGEGKWIHLKFKDSVQFPEAFVDRLDPSLIVQFILNPVFAIYDQRTDERLSYKPDLDGGLTVKEIIDSGEYEFAIRMAPIDAKDVRLVSDNNEIMPPKSTYIEPKLRSGLLIYPLNYD